MKDPKFGHLVQRLVIVHFDPPSEFPGHGQNHWACNHDQIVQVESHGEIPRPWDQATGVPGVVTCPACKKTAVFKAAWEAAEDDVCPTGPDDDEEAPRITPAIAGSFDRLQRITTPYLKK